MTSSTFVKITPFAGEHYDRVIALWQRCEGVGLSSADNRDNIEAYLRRNPGMSFVARRQGEMVGAVLCGHDGRRGYVHHLAVDPRHRRQGIGRSLVDHCLAALGAAGIQKCHLFIFGLNEGGRRFWEAIGWEFRQDVGVMSRHVPSV